MPMPPVPTCRRMRNQSVPVNGTSSRPVSRGLHRPVEERARLAVHPEQPPQVRAQLRIAGAGVVKVEVALRRLLEHGFLENRAQPAMALRRRGASHDLYD